MIPESAVEAAWDKLHENPIRPIGIDYAELEAALEAAAPHMQVEHKNGTPVNENDATLVTIPRAQLEGWPTTPPLTGTDWRNFAESLPASEFATTLLFVADGIDKADGAGWHARDSAQ